MMQDPSLQVGHFRKFHHCIVEGYTVMAQEKCWGASAVKVPTLSGAKEFHQTMPIILPKKTKNRSWISRK